MLDVGQHELLVLLLVVHSELDQRVRLARQRAALEELLHRAIDMLAIGKHAIERGTRQETALGSRMLVADAVVIRIEQHAKSRIERAVAAEMRVEYESLEEPACV